MKKGQSLIELLVVIAMMAIILPAILSGFVTSRSGKAQQVQKIQAVPLLKEAIEATRAVRNKNWNTFAVDGIYHPQISGNTWVLSSGSESINGYQRSVVISDVYRDSSGAIVTSGGALDPSTKKALVTVSWTTPYSSSVSSALYFTRFVSNSSYTQTTTDDFNQGTKTDVVVSAAGGGQVSLGSVGGAGNDWCSPTLSINSVDLPGQGIATAISAISGHAYTTTGGNSSGHSMDSVSISDPPYPSPPVATNAGSYDNYKTYGIFATSNYVYLTSDHPNLTVDIVSVNNLTHAGYFNASGGGAGKSVAVSGNTGFVTAGSALYSFDVSQIKGSLSQTQLGSVSLSGTGNKIVIVGNYAFVATSSTNSQLQIIDISSPSNMTVASSTNLGNNLSAVDVSVNFSGTVAYIVTNYSSGANNFFIVNTSNKNSPIIIGSSNTNGMSPKGIAVVPGNRTIIVGSGGEQYQVFDTTILSSPSLCGGLSNPNGASSINAVASVLENDNDAFSYILTNNSSSEFQIIAGGQFATTGTFESSTFSNNSPVTFNRFFVNGYTPPLTTLKFQISAADANPTTNDCSGVSFSYIGPDLSGSSYFATSSAIPLSTSGSYKNPSRCFRYKAFFSTTDITQSPVLYDFTVNYSP